MIKHVHNLIHETAVYRLPKRTARENPTHGGAKANVRLFYLPSPQAGEIWLYSTQPIVLRASSYPIFDFSFLRSALLLRPAKRQPLAQGATRSDVATRSLWSIILAAHSSSMSHTDASALAWQSRDCLLLSATILMFMSSCYTAQLVSL